MRAQSGRFAIGSGHPVNEYTSVADSPRDRDHASGGSAIPKNSAMLSLRFEIWSRVSRPIRIPSLDLGTVEILSTMAYEVICRPFVSEGTISNRTGDASTAVCVSGHIVMESV